MNKNLHDMDGLFRNAYRQFEEEPSTTVWEKLNATLDEKDGKSDKKRSAIIKVGLTLVVLLTAYVLFDPVIFRIGDHGKNHDITPRELKKPATPDNDKIPISARNFTEKKNIGTPDLNPENDNKKTNSDPLTLFADRTTASFPKPFKNEDVRKWISPVSGHERPNRPTIGEINEWLKFPVSLFDINSVSILESQKKQLPLINDAVLKNKISKNASFDKKGSWLLTIFVSYDQAGYKLDSDIPNNITSIKHREAHEPSFSGGVLAGKPLTRSLSVQSGLIFSHTMIGMSPQKIYALQDPSGDISYKYITSSGYAFIKPGFSSSPTFGDSLITAEGKHIIQSIAVPLTVHYTIREKKLTISPGAGIEANLITNTKVETEIEDASNKETVFINKLNGSQSFYWSLTGQLDLRYNVSKKTEIILHPSFRRALSPITKNNDVETFPYNFGIGWGITFKF